MWTREETYADPDADLLRAADGWLRRIRPERLRYQVRCRRAPHGPKVLAFDRVIHYNSVSRARRGLPDGHRLRWGTHPHRR